MSYPVSHHHTRPPYIRAAAAGLLLAAAFSLSSTGPAIAEDGASTPEQIVNVMNTMWGKQTPGQRANHAKGLLAEGTFTPSPDAKKLSRAGIFAGKTIPVTVRFSDATGLPHIADVSPNANPHGMAIRFHDKGHTDVDVITNSLPFFPVRTPEEFLQLLTAISKSKDAPHPTPAEQFIATHPTVAGAVGALKTPSSFARETYNGINTFIFTDSDGKKHPFRFKISPISGAHHLTQQEAEKQKPDFLVDELPTRLKKGPVKFALYAVLAEKDDAIDDGSKPFPADRRQVQLGTISIKNIPEDADKQAASILFLPGNLETGIEASADPLIDARNAAYAVSFSRRQ
ncbi:catalase family peroxidase [Granulibacter bethesdensis]|uniref:Catalase-related peroxidase n=1 Tax=Granulibacter bethesdensis (strain ATCC BAA-1260 / CGDNIH1) TaxID=391165 RepID=Q0BRN8_GRABC|nr:catalase family peroxidase [Granulibacter bethesdensis]ABI62513.1 catalase-like protein [Granulibacter bethesdensis CGDNIH1]AHJ68544.1 catalase-like protein [Granulibacter bethesdensis]APH52356.1 catalase-like protein [Granulibacter bethesdensis]APH65050.1 catalase-like protein [Granulibacter bethesdensis]